MFKTNLFKATVAVFALFFTVVVAKAVIILVNSTGFDPNNACIGNLRQISLGLDSYIQDYDEKFPLMDSDADLKTEIGPFVKANSNVFICPANGYVYLTNNALSHQAIASIESGYDTEELKDSQPHRDSFKTIVYVDGHVTHGGVVQGDPNQNCFGNMKQLAVAMQQYVQDYDEHFPIINSQPQFEADLSPYVKTATAFSCPVTSALYSPNLSLNGVTLDSIASPQTTVVAEDSVVHPDGALSTAYVDGHTTNSNIPSSMATQPQPSCMQNLKLIYQGVQIYSQLNNGNLPPTDTAAHFIAALETNGPTISLACPESGQPYALNPTVSGENVGNLDPSTPLLSDTSPNNNFSLYTLTVTGKITSQYYSIPACLAVDSTGASAIEWTRAGTGGADITMMDLGLTGSVTKSLIYSYTTPPFPGSYIPFTVSTVNSDQRVFMLMSSLPLQGISSPAPSMSVAITNTSGVIASDTVDGPYDGWVPISLADGGSTYSHLLMRYYTGICALWLVAPDGTYHGSITLAPNPGEKPIALADAAGGTQKILFSEPDGAYKVWSIGNQPRPVISIGPEIGGPSSGQKIVNITAGPDKVYRLLVSDGNGVAEIWTLNSAGSATPTVMLTEPSNWIPSQLGVDSAGNFLVFWKAAGANARLTNITPSGTILYDQVYAPTM